MARTTLSLIYCWTLQFDGLMVHVALMERVTSAFRDRAPSVMLPLDIA